MGLGAAGRNGIPLKTARERELFMLLISVSGIGPKSGIAMLSGMSADEIITAIRTDNLRVLVGDERRPLVPLALRH